jgi:hypothetical protein
VFVRIGKAELVALDYLRYNWGVWVEEGLVRGDLEEIEIKSDNFWVADWFRSTVRFEVKVNSRWKAEINLRRENGRWTPHSAAPLNFAYGPMKKFVVV